MPSRNTYRLTWVSLTLHMGYLFTTAPAKHSHLPWMRGILLTAALPDLERGVAPLSLPAPVQQPLLGGGVAPLGHKASLNKFKQLESMQSLFYINKYNKLYINKLYILHSSITLKINNRRKFGKSTTI